MGDVSIYVVDADGSWGFVRQGKEELQVIGVVDMGGGVGILTAQPLVEAFDFWKHAIPPDGRIATILPPGERLWEQG
jgi:hypothetical protein